MLVCLWKIIRKYKRFLSHIFWIYYALMAMFLLILKIRLINFVFAYALIDLFFGNLLVFNPNGYFLMCFMLQFVFYCYCCCFLCFATLSDIILRRITKSVLGIIVILELFANLQVCFVISNLQSRLRVSKAVKSAPIIIIFFYTFIRNKIFWSLS